MFDKAKETFLDDRRVSISFLLIFVLSENVNNLITPQDGQHSISQYAPAQAGPAAEADRGEAEAEASDAEQEDRAERPEGRGRRQEPAWEQQQEGTARLRRPSTISLSGQPGLHDYSPGQSTGSTQTNTFQSSELSIKL